MNGFQPGRTPFGFGASNPPMLSSGPGSRNMANAFARKEMPNGFGKPSPPIDSTEPVRPQTTARVDLKDAIQVHLLTETALTDSKGYEIMSQEEVDELKKVSQLLSQRVESTRKNLAIQSKYRDAAVSMAKLYGPDRSNDPNAIEAERERKACERQCEQLSVELFNLEKRLMVPQRRLLEHTAGILQLTHKASKRKAPPPIGQLVNGIPGSPESLYTSSLGRNSLEQNAEDAYLDDPSLYQLDFANGNQTSRQARKNAIEIPLKSPNREQQQLRSEMDRMREENMQLRGEMDRARDESSAYRSQTDAVIRQLQNLNLSLRETIIRFNPDNNRDYQEPPNPAATPDAKPADLLKSQVEYLGSGLVAVQAEQESFVGGKEMGQRVQSLNQQMGNILQTADPAYTPAPIPPDSDVQGQFDYLEASLRVAGSKLAQPTSGGLDAETGPVLERLWENLQNGLAETRKRREDRKKYRTEKGLTEEEDVSDDEGFDPSESYSLVAFASRVQWLNVEASTLKDQKYVLKRQIKQQRELNNKSDADRDEELKKKQEEVEQSRSLLAKAEQDADETQTLLTKTLEDLEVARNSAGAAEASAADLKDRDARIQTLEAQLKEATSNLTAAESQGSGAAKKLADMDDQIASLTQEKTAADEKVQSLSQELQQKTTSLTDKEKALKLKETEIEQLNMTLAELKLECTIAQAELDGAYGTRAERAADVAALKNNAETVKLQNQVERLKQELGDTVKELEGITKETIGAEREKVELEVKLDEAISAKEAVEAEMQKSRETVTKLQEELDGERLKVASAPGSGGKPGAGASMLSEQFRATMREERKRFQEDLKEERARCRKLEEELNRLKRGQGSGKLPLSPQ
ncbi:hypothetical protein HIM_00208 [Hirsutella minnesotensis 3608]|nr:hypothetical protein HIM_00208 [Hirsutella minnesotensis 3608]